MIKKKKLLAGMCGGIIGCIFVALNMSLYANIVWILSNPLMVIYNYRIKEYGQAWLWTLYVIIATFGLLKHLIGG
jgi:hypothetical protein